MVVTRGRFISDGLVDLSVTTTYVLDTALHRKRLLTASQLARVIVDNPIPPFPSKVRLQNGPRSPSSEPYPPFLNTDTIIGWFNAISVVFLSI